MFIDGKHVCGEKAIKSWEENLTFRQSRKLWKDSIGLESRKLTDAIINECVGARGFLERIFSRGMPSP